MSKLGDLVVTKHTGDKQTGTVIFFHGSGSTGKQMKEWVDALFGDFEFPHLKVLYPTAPMQAYTPAGLEKSNVWFDREAISPYVPEKEESLAEIEKEIKKMIQDENAAGIPSSRIVVGGFSMGGALALHTAYRWDKDLAGVFVVSSFLNTESLVYLELPGRCLDFKSPPLLQLHGYDDDLVDFEWGLNTFKKLQILGVNGDFIRVERLGHAIDKTGLFVIKRFIEEQCLPPN